MKKKCAILLAFFEDVEYEVFFFLKIAFYDKTILLIKVFPTFHEWLAIALFNNTILETTNRKVDEWRGCRDFVLKTHSFIASLLHIYLCDFFLG